MEFRKVLFGYSPSEVALRIERLQTELETTQKQLHSLAQENRRLEYANDELMMKVSIYEELYRGRQSPESTKPSVQSTPKE